MSDRITAPIFLDRYPDAERPFATRALDTFRVFRTERGEVLSPAFGAALRGRLRREVGPTDASRAYDVVVAYLDWLVSCGVNSANPLRLRRHSR